MLEYLQAGGMGQVLEHMTSKSNSPVLPKERERIFAT
jgi:hypothetical protein